MANRFGGRWLALGAALWVVFGISSSERSTASSLSHVPEPFSSSWTTASSTTGFVAISVGGGHTCGLTATGGVKCWGANYMGQLGDGTRTDRYMPVYVTGLTTGVIAVSAGSSHTCALLATGGMKCWGENNRGQLGDGTKAPRFTPVDVTGLTSDVIAIEAGGLDTCAITTGGGLKCWGSNYRGKLGDGTIIERWTPVDVVGLSSSVVAVRANDSGGAHTCAVLAGGSLKCWGSNEWGQLGDGSGADQYTPVDVAGLSSGVRDVALGMGHTCAALEAGGVKCWGLNNAGQLGDDSTTDRTTPVAVSGPIGSATRVAAGSNHSCALLQAGGVKCWGFNFSGELGDGTTVNRLTPVDVVGLAGEALTVSAGGSHTCASFGTGQAQCWGANEVGQLGNGQAMNFLAPTPNADLSIGVTAVTLGWYHACALVNGGVQCWGDNGFGQLGAGETVTQTPAGVIGLSGDVSAIATGSIHTCAIQNGGVQCWGDNRAGQLGDGYTLTQYSPVSVTGLISGVVSVSAGYRHSCALTEAGGVQCWGENVAGGCTQSSSLTPIDVCGLTEGVTAVASGDQHACALLATGGVKCWGANHDGQLGDGTTTPRPTPVDVIGLPMGAQSIAAGASHTCALLLDGTVTCWGNYTYGQLGNGTVGGAQAITAGDIHSCAIVTGGRLLCWGYNFYGQLGDGTLDDSGAPRQVVGLTSGVTAVDAGYKQTCAVVNGSLLCWGNNEYGLINPDRFARSPIPVTVLNPEWRARLPLTLHNYQPLHAGFTADPVEGLAPLRVVFTNTSTGSDLASEWDFGDGVTSTVPSPSHTYTESGVYTATLIVHGSGDVAQATTVINVRPGQEMLYNGGFEVGQFGWLWDGVPEFARVITEVAHSGTHSALFGIVPPAPLVYSYGSGRFMITIPCTAVEARLSFWYWPRREGLSGNPARNNQFAYARDGMGVLRTLFLIDDDLPDWQYAQYDLADFACRTIEIQFGVTHDGSLVYGQRTWLYVDDVSLVIDAPPVPVYPLAYYPFDGSARDASGNGSHDVSRTALP